MDSRLWQEAFAEWLGTFAWDWFGSLTFRPDLSKAQRRSRLRFWIQELQTELGDDTFQWLAVPELGRTGQNFHFHVLIGGLRKSRARERLFWMKRWNRLCGDSLITPFNPTTSSGVRYILKHVRPNDMDSVEIHLRSNPVTTNLGAK